MMIFTLVYVSDCNLLPFGDLASAKLDKIAKSSAFNNDLFDVRGFLFYYENKFLQVLQGEFDSIISVFAKIKDDPSHSNIRIVWFSSAETHAFEKWSMLFSMEYASDNFARLRVKPSTIARFVPERGHLTPQAFQLLMDVATQSLEDLGQTQEKLLHHANV